MKFKKLLTIVLCFVMLVMSVPTAWAANDTVTVSFLFSNGETMQSIMSMTVSDGTAEQYGFAVAEKDHRNEPIKTVTMMDVLVAAHAAVYGEAFTAQTASEYLVVENSFMTKVFGIETSNLGLTVNNEMPHDDTYVDSALGGYYTCYAIDTARVKDGDLVSVFAIKNAAYADVQPLIDCPDFVAPDTPFTVTVTGYSIMLCGYDKQEVIDSNTKPLAGATLECTQDFRSFKSLGTLDADGKLSVTLSEGNWYLVVRGALHNKEFGDLPLIATYKTVSSDPGFSPLVQKPIRFPLFFYPVFVRDGYKIRVCLKVFWIDLRTFMKSVTTTERDLFAIPMEWFFRLTDR